MTLTNFMRMFLNIQMIDQIQIVVMESKETAAYDLWESSTPDKMLQQINDIYGDLVVVGCLLFVDEPTHKSIFHFQLSERGDSSNDPNE